MITSREEKKMADVMATVNGNEYSEEKFKKDLTRMFDAYRGKDDSDMGNMNCNGVCCDDCPLYKVSCNMKTTNSFKTIGIVYEWALEHPVITNQKKLEEVFGKEIIDEFGEYIHFDSYGFYKWIGQEYKKPKGESKNDD
jgi:hypothetical protein